MLEADDDFLRELRIEQLDIYASLAVCHLEMAASISRMLEEVAVKVLIEVNTQVLVHGGNPFNDPSAAAVVDLTLLVQRARSLLEQSVRDVRPVTELAQTGYALASGASFPRTVH